MSWTEARIWIVGALFALAIALDAPGAMLAGLFLSFLICLAVAMSKNGWV